MIIIKYLAIVLLVMPALTVYLSIGMAFCNMASTILSKFRINTFILEDFLEKGAPFVWVWPVLFINFVVRMFFTIPFMIAQKIVKPKDKLNKNKIGEIENVS